MATEREMDEEIPEKGEEKEEQGKENQEEKVSLSASQYEALLNRLEELEALSQLERPKRRREIDEDEEEEDLDSIAAKGKKRRTAEEETEEQLSPEQVDGMSNSELLSLFDRRGQNILAPLYQKLMENEIKAEIREIRRDEKVKPEFDAYWTLTYKIAKQNPEMSIDDAFQLAKVKFPGRYKKGAPGEKGEKGGELKLPPRPRTFGEKGGASAHGTESTKPKTDIEDIASAKFDEIVLGKK